ncbi:hypothetical protein BCV72DRAFT_209308, partial [Rhizopus microsporus var. microsporus]
YQLFFTITDTLIHCLYLPPSLDNQTVLEILSSLPSTTPNTRQTIICDNFNAKLGFYTRDRSINLFVMLYTAGLKKTVLLYGIGDWLLANLHF